MTSSDPLTLAVRSPADLIAAVPYLLGFHPAESLVAVALRGRRIVFVARADLPPPGIDEQTTATYLVDVLARQDATAVTVVGYGSAPRVTPVVDAVRRAMTGSGMLLLDALRVTDGRYWSYLCPEPECCPPEGRPYDPMASEVTATAVYAGQVALPDRAALTAQVAPVEGPARVAMRRATAMARRRLADLLHPVAPGAPVDPADDPIAPVGAALRARPDQAPGRLSEAERVRAAGAAAVRSGLRRHRRSTRLTDAEVAWLSLLLTHLPVRDDAWEKIDGGDEHLGLWTEVLRRAEPDLAVVPACLLAFAAWQAGQGALAAVAVERALDAQPDYPLAQLLDEVLRQGVPPSMLTGRPVTSGGAASARRDRRHRKRPG